MLLSAISLILITFILLWTMYNIPIALAGVRNCRQQTRDRPISVSQLPKVSLIVPAKNEGKVIARCMSTLLSLDYPREKMEILVVDGSSEDGTTSICSAFAKRFPHVVKVLREDRSTGKPKALNFALPHVTGEVVGVFDADSVPDRSVLKQVAAKFQDPTVMAVQGRTRSLNPDENMVTRIATMERQSWLQALVRGRTRLGLFVPLTGSCQFVRRAVLEELGGWAEASLAEDVELSLRLVEHKYAVEYAPDACSREETPSCMVSLIQQRTRWYRGYMEEGFKYGRLLKHINRRTLDAEMSLMGPFIMVACLASYLNWGLTLLLPTPPIDFLPNLAMVVTSLTLFGIGVALVLIEKPMRLRNLVWIPFIYAYWILQTLIAGRAFLLTVLRRPRMWRKTVKHGS
jgi:cellulose synthase/poly-beta-1,6-N-acetylglucosamine synthase-like glycosyltransferase